MQCKDIPDRPIIELIASQHPKWCNRLFRDAGDVRRAMPHDFDTPSRLVLAKMARLIKRGLIDGCDCGCRGDYEMTEKGWAFLGKEPPTHTQVERYTATASALRSAFPTARIG